MNNPTCRVCGGKMKRNGYTKAGTKRFRCIHCGASYVRKHNNDAKTLRLFLDWLKSKKSIKDLKINRTTFWRKTAFIWKLWPIAPFTGEIHDVIYFDGIYIGRGLVVLIAFSDRHAIAWHLAQSESSESWAALLVRIPAPKMAVSDGSSGFAKAVSHIWPHTRIQRCLVHAARRVKSFTTQKPKLEAGIELLGIANKLTHIDSAEKAAEWLVEYNAWCDRWHAFLKEYTYKDGKRVFTHERLRSARYSLNTLIKQKTIFTYIEMQQQYGGVWPSTNNPVESFNATLRRVLFLHRGLSVAHRMKAVFWICYMNTENPLSEAEILRVMPTDSEVKGIYKTISKRSQNNDGRPEEYGCGINWQEFHMPTEYRE